ncbi:MAG TPA: hypothetical protein VJB61_00580 [Actinomycetota bacterium]|jgi:hypothetical protein
MPWVTREVPEGSGRWRAVNEPARPHPGAAPPLDCAVCGRRIGKTRTHFLLNDQRVICERCRMRPDPRVYDDQVAAMGTRAGIAHVLGLWP